MDNQKEFKPIFKGYMKLFLHDTDAKRLASRATFTEQWVEKRRGKILRKSRLFKITLHFFDADGNKRGLKEVVFTSKGGHGELSKVIFEHGNQFADELRANDETLVLDLVNSYAVVRA